MSALTLRFLFKLPDGTTFPSPALTLTAGAITYTIEAEAMQQAGNGTLQVEATRGTEQVWLSEPIATVIQESAEGDEAPEAIPGYIAQMNEAIDGANAAADDLIERRDAGEFNGADGSPGAAGKDGADGAPGPLVTQIPGTNLMRLIKHITLTEAAASVTIDVDEAGAAFSLKDCKIFVAAVNGVGDKTTGASAVGIRINAISAGGSYYSGTDKSSSSLYVSSGNKMSQHEFTFHARGNRIGGSCSSHSLYSASTEGAGSPGASAQGFNTIADPVNFNTIRRIEVWGIGGTTESNIHAGAVIELWGIDA
jgi:hypothetical protein